MMTWNSEASDAPEKKAVSKSIFLNVTLVALVRDG
jgi:hypothetical protein